jgi:hypothetical protein
VTISIYKNDYYRTANLFICFAAIIWAIINDKAFQTGTFGSALLFLVFNALCSFLSRQTFYSWPVIIIRGSGAFRYIIVALAAFKDGVYTFPDDNWIVYLEMMAIYFAIFLFDVRHQSRADNTTVAYEAFNINDDNIRSSNQRGVIITAILIVAGAYVITHREILSLYFSLSTNKASVVYANGLIALLVNLFFLIIYIKAFLYFQRLSLPEWIIIILQIAISIFYINGSSIHSDNVSRWSMLITGLLAYVYLVRFHPKYKKVLLIGLLVILIFAVFFGSMIKFSRLGNQDYMGMNSTVNSLFSYKNLNAYFAGPTNIHVGIEMIKSVHKNGTSPLLMFISDFFNNFPLLNRILNLQDYASHIIFNRIYYGSSIAVDQILPLSCQLYNFFNIGFIIPEAGIVYFALIQNNKIKTEENMLLTFCEVYLVASLSLVNCLNMTVMLQGVWLQVLPAFLVYWINRTLVIKGD